MPKDKIKTKGIESLFKSRESRIKGGQLKNKQFKKTPKFKGMKRGK